MVSIFKSHEAIEHTKPHLTASPVIIEAGAFDGRDTCALARAWPHGTIHAFEPVPELFERLKKNTATLNNVNCYQMALSDYTGTALFYVSEKPDKPGRSSQAGSLHKPKERLKRSPIQFPHIITVETITLHDWVRRFNITTIDMLWLDMQGHELSVMQASPDIMSCVLVIYTEVGFIEAYEGQQPYSVVKQWVVDQQFKEIGRTFENQVDWFFGNVLFLKNRVTTY